MFKKNVQLPISIGIVVLLILLGSATASAQQDSLLYSQDFESGWPGEWEADRGWEVAESDSGMALFGSGHNWVSLNTGSWDDYSLRFNLKLASEATVHANFRMSEGPARYFIGFSPAQVYLSKQTGPDQFSEWLAKSDGVGLGWNSLEITGRGSLITVFVNDQEVMRFNDPDPLLSGGIAFESLTESQVQIDDIEIWGPGEPLTQSSPEPQSSEPGTESGELAWVRLGGPPGGLGYDIRYKFDDPSTWYVTDASAGVHISTDNGLTWHQSNQGIDTVGGAAGDGVPVFSLTIDPHNTDIIWIGTDLTGDIYKSIDGGQNWVKKSTGIIHEDGIVMSFRGFTVHPQTSDIVYAMGELQKPGNNVWGLGVGGVVYKTTDGGEHWTRIWYGAIPSSLTRYMWIHPDHPDILYVSTGIFDRGAVGETDHLTNPWPFGGLGVLKSTDGGKSWEVLGEKNGLDFRYIGSLFMDPDDPEVLYAAAGHVVSELAYQQLIAEKQSPLGIYRTSDGGETWQQILEPEANILVQTFSSVEICPGNANIIYAGSDAAIYRSSDRGDSWTLMAGETGTWGPVGVRAGWPIDMQCDPRDPDRVFTNNYSGGNFLSEDGGRTWINASSGYSGAQIIGVAVDPFNSARVFAVGRSGAWKSTDGGMSWSGIHNPGETTALAGGEWGGVAFDPMIEDHILLGSETILGWRPEDNRWQFSEYLQGYGPETSEIEFAPSDPNIVYAVSANHNSMIHAYNYESGRGIILSRDGGKTWQVITGHEFSDSILTDVSVDFHHPNIVYVAAQNGLYQSQDYGATWNNLVITSPGKPVRTVAVHPIYSNIIFAGLPGNGIFFSDDGGKSWSQSYAGLEPNGDYRDIIFDLTDPNIIYLSDIASGVYQSKDQGNSWIKLSNGLSNRAATSLSLSSDGNHLYSGTAGGGVFRLDLNGLPPDPYQPDQESDPENPEEISQPSQAETGESHPEKESSSEETKSTGSKFLPCLSGLVPLAIAGLAAIGYRRD
jgi:photosystem II stability/assembly factor-like uncharacterized protein